ncbi:MAG: DUF1801 domain-containing protein [Spirochaetes bacterium]|nr:DUF1801 domain-containing protein [Spirochaetota bacterium]
MNSVYLYISNLPEIRKTRINDIRNFVHSVFPDASESMKYKMPTFEYNGNRVSMASQKNYLSIYFCNAKLIKNVTDKYPQIKSGKACLNIKDSDPFPINEIGKSIIIALNEEKPDK